MMVSLPENLLISPTMLYFSAKVAGRLPGSLGVMPFEKTPACPKGGRVFREFFSWFMFHYLIHAAGTPLRRSGG